MNHRGRLGEQEAQRARKMGGTEGLENGRQGDLVEDRRHRGPESEAQRA